MHTNRVFNGLRVIETAKRAYSTRKGGGGGGYSQKIWVSGGVRSAYQTPYPIYDQTLRY